MQRDSALDTAEDTAKKKKVRSEIVYMCEKTRRWKYKVSQIAEE